jgi:acyl carrier protein
MSVGDRAKEIIVKQLGVAPERVTDAATFGDDLGADDLERIEIVMAFEDAFGCEIDDETIETFHTVGDAVRFLETRAS